MYLVFGLLLLLTITTILLLLLLLLLLFLLSGLHARLLFHHSRLKPRPLPSRRQRALVDYPLLAGAVGAERISVELGVQRAGR
ncbi:hypothetical protein T492DRAFT_317676 [Pavlovales sp. CCMP2436]|nr:hypothetical protein T492DRAFT_317676 [Pavlovales sp. CCMP2436]